MKKVFVDTLMAGVDNAEHYGVDAKGDVFLIGKDGEASEVTEEVANQVRKRINTQPPANAPDSPSR